MWKKVAKQPVIMKLSPNVTRIGDMARAAEAGGADAVSLINTITGMKIDINRRKFVLANKTGGMSGPAPQQQHIMTNKAEAVKHAAGHSVSAPQMQTDTAVMSIYSIEAE